MGGGKSMKRERKFIMDGELCAEKRPDFYNFEFFDHDLVLFCDSKSGLRFDFDSLSIIGGRNASALFSYKLSEFLALDNEDCRFLTDFLHDGGRNFAFLISRGKPVMIFNRLFGSLSLGIAIVFDRGAREIVSVAGCGEFEDLGERIYSPSILSILRQNGEPTPDHGAFVHSALKICRTLSSIVSRKDRDLDIVERVRMVADMIGCKAKIDVVGEGLARTLDGESAAALLLCLLSICRRLSLTREAEILLDKEREYVKIAISFDCIDDKLSDSEVESIRYCERLASKLELPLSIELSSGRFKSEFIPFHVDPSIYGLKAGIKIKYYREG